MEWGQNQLTRVTIAVIPPRDNAGTFSQAAGMPPVAAEAGKSVDVQAGSRSVSPPGGAHVMLRQSQPGSFSGTGFPPGTLLPSPSSGSYMATQIDEVRRTPQGMSWIMPAPPRWARGLQSQG